MEMKNRRPPKHLGSFEAMRSPLLEMEIQLSICHSQLYHAWSSAMIEGIWIPHGKETNTTWTFIGGVGDTYGCRTYIKCRYVDGNQTAIMKHWQIVVTHWTFQNPKFLKLHCERRSPPAKKQLVHRCHLWSWTLQSLQHLVTRTC